MAGKSAPTAESAPAFSAEQIASIEAIMARVIASAMTQTAPVVAEPAADSAPFSLETDTPVESDPDDATAPLTPGQELGRLNDLKRLEALRTERDNAQRTRDAWEYHVRSVPPGSGPSEVALKLFAGELQCFRALAGLYPTWKVSEMPEAVREHYRRDYSLLTSHMRKHVGFRGVPSQTISEIARAFLYNGTALHSEGIRPRDHAPLVTGDTTARPLDLKALQAAELRNVTRQ